MNFKETTLKLTTSNVSWNSVQRNVSKEGLNSILGKMSQGITIYLYLISFKNSNKVFFL